MRSCSLAIVYGVALIVIVGCSPAAETASSTLPLAQEQHVRPEREESLILPIVKRGEPKVYISKQHDPEKWLTKTNANKANTWFKASDGSWYINWDAERQPFDLIVIHHSATSENASAAAIDQIQKKRLYAPRYRSDHNDPYVQGLPPHSGHIIGSEERFIAYHHLVYSDGNVTTELQPLIKIKDTWFVDMVGWHAGNWEANCRSIGICLVGNFSKKEPSAAQLQATIQLIAHYRTFNPNLEVQPHKMFTSTECPGKAWEALKEKLPK